MVSQQRSVVLERRQTTGKVSVGSDKKIRGTAVVYNVLSEDLGGFRERIAPGAFKDFLATQPDVVALFNHDYNQLLGRTASGSVVLTDTPEGLQYEITPADTQGTRDLMALIERGDVTGSSFGFFLGQDKVETAKDGSIVRTVLAAQLDDVSPVVRPAYPDTSVSVRSLFPYGLPDSLRSALKTKTVDGVKLPASCFAYVGDPDKVETWVFPIEFPGDVEKTKEHIQLAIDLWKTDKTVPDADREKVWEKIAAAAKAHGIDLPADGDRDWRKDAELWLLEIA